MSIIYHKDTGERWCIYVGITRVSSEDDNVSFLIEIIRRLMPQKSSPQLTISSNDEDGMEAFRRLETARAEIRQYLPEDFDPDKELEEARAERYGSIG